jgi:hypothetical protein
LLSRFTIIAAGVAALLTSSAASAQKLELDFGGAVKADMRFEVDDDVPIERMETWLSGRMSGKYGQHVGGVAKLDFVFVHKPNAKTFEGLSDRQALDPFRIESSALFVEFKDVGIDGLDIRMGRQQVIWGAADRFHPTSNLNALDLEDSLAFGDTIANEMVSVRYSPYVFAGDEDEPWFEELSFELVWVPQFVPAQLPESGGLAFTDPNETIRLANHSKLRALAREFKGFIEAGAEVNWDLRVKQPEFALDNSMVGFRMAWNLLGVDMSLSYFRGFEDIPRGEKAVVNGNSGSFAAQVDLAYPQVQVIGADFATSIPWLDGMGLWAEVGVFFHDDLYLVIDGREFSGYENIPALNTPPVREHEAGQFVKAVVGVDYTPVPWWYINIQYLHGFIDEFGTDDLEDYLVAGMDFKMARDKVTLRLFSMIDLTDQSFVLFPQIITRPWTGGEITVGAFLYSGLFGLPTDTKFGSPVAGASTVFTRATWSF